MKSGVMGEKKITTAMAISRGRREKNVDEMKIFIF